MGKRGRKPREEVRMSPTRPLAALLALATLAACSASGSATVTPDPGATPGAGATTPPAQADCTTTETRDARIFRVDAPARTAANTAFTVKAWTYLEKSPAQAIESVKAGSYTATVDAAAKTITIAGQIDAVVPKPGGDCAFTMIAGGDAQAVDVTVTAPAGTYELVVPGYPPSPPSVVPPTAPQPAEPGSVEVF
jgi:hypothetical protein